MSTVVACPECKQNLALPPEMVGQTVRCPSCANTFVATVEAVQASVPPPLPASNVPEWDKPRPEEEFAAPIDERPAADERPRRQRPREKPGGGYYEELARKQRKMQAPHRAVHVLTLGLFSVLCSWACLLAIGACACGYYAYQMGSYDLGEMQVNRMDRSGEALTRVGWILGICGMCLSVPVILASLGFIVLSMVRALTGPAR